LILAVNILSKALAEKAISAWCYEWTQLEQYWWRTSGRFCRLW